MKGAVLAAQKIFPRAKPRSTRFEIPNDHDDEDDEDDDDDLCLETKEKCRKNNRQLTPDEIRCELEDELRELPPPVRVVFANMRCRACGQTGDPRLMEAKCHRNKTRGHTGTLRQRFSSAKVAGSLGVGLAGCIALGVAAAVSTAGSMVLVGIPFVLLPGLAVGGHRMLNKRITDTSVVSACDVNDMRWTCCGQRESREPNDGCTDLCDNCGAVWGGGEPCVQISNMSINQQDKHQDVYIYKKTHDLVTCPHDQTNFGKKQQKNGQYLDCSIDLESQMIKNRLNGV